MEAIEITEKDLDNFQRLLGEDLTDDLGRIFYRGIGVVDSEGNPLGAMTCELMNEDSCEENECRIRFLQSKNKEVFDVMHDYFTVNLVMEEGVSQSLYELADQKETEALSGVGFSREKKESDSLIVTLGQLAESKLAKTRKPPAYIDTLGTLSSLQYRDTLKQILFKGHNGIMEDISYLPKRWFDNGISACVISEERVSGLFLIRKTPSGMLIPALFFANGPGYRRNLFYMLKFTVQKAIQCYPSETPVMIVRQNEHIRALTDWIFPGQKGQEVFCGMRKEQK